MEELKQNEVTLEESAATPEAMPAKEKISKATLVKENEELKAKVAQLEHDIKEREDYIDKLYKQADETNRKLAMIKGAMDIIKNHKLIIETAEKELNKTINYINTTL